MKGYEFKMPIGMLFKRMYCSKCGTKLVKYKVTHTYHKGDEGYQNHILGHATIGMDKIFIGTYVYKCNNCNTIITYDDQLKVSKTQKQFAKKILLDKEIKQ